MDPIGTVPTWTLMLVVLHSQQFSVPISDAVLSSSTIKPNKPNPCLWVLGILIKSFPTMPSNPNLG